MMKSQCFAILVTLLAHVQAGNILFVPPMLGQSHKMAMLPWADRLTELGHHVLLWEPAPKLSKHQPKLAKVEQFQVSIEHEFLNNIIVHENATFIYEKAWNSASNEPWEESVIMLASTMFCRELLRSHQSKIDQLLTRKWDVIILDELFNPCGYMLAGRLKREQGTAVALYVSTTTITTTAAAYDNIPYPLAYIPNFGTRQSYTDFMTFFQRVHNVLLHSVRRISDVLVPRISDWLLSNHSVFELTPLTESIYEPDLVFAGHLKSLEFPRPSVRNLVHIGGITRGIQANPLSEELAGLVAQHRGFIVISFGHNARWDHAPIALRRAFIDALSRLPADVLVIFQYIGTSSQFTVPKNIRFFHWIPLLDLLKHPKALLLITHGGCNSITEAAVQGVPMIVVPLHGDQPDAAARIEKWDIGIRIPKQELTQGSLFRAITAILETDTYRLSAKKFASQIQEELTSPLERAVFWTEVLVKENQKSSDRPVPYSYFLHSQSSIVSPIQYHCIDVLTCLLLFTSFTTYWTLKGFSKLCGAILSWKRKS